MDSKSPGPPGRASLEKIKVTIPVHIAPGVAGPLTREPVLPLVTKRSLQPSQSIDDP